MEHTPANPLLQSVSLRALRIATWLRVHPDFFKAPVAFAHRRRVDLVGNVFPKTSFKGDPDSREKTAKVGAYANLVRQGAVRLLIERRRDHDWMKRIDLDPSLQLYGGKDFPIAEDDLRLSLRNLRTAVAPLLADPDDSRFIVPGVGDTGEHRAYWSLIESEVSLPDVFLAGLHGMRHPEIGPAEGGNARRIKIGETRDDRVILFRKASRRITGASDTKGVQGVRVTLTLKGFALLEEFYSFGETALVEHYHRLVAFSALDVARVHLKMMSRLGGTYLPVPPEWADRALGKPVTHAKTIALLSRLTPIPLEELRAMDGRVRHSSASTRKRLKKDVGTEVGRLKPVPASTLFGPAVAAAVPGRGHGTGPG